MAKSIITKKNLKRVDVFKNAPIWQLLLLWKDEVSKELETLSEDAGKKDPPTLEEMGGDTVDLARGYTNYEKLKSFLEEKPMDEQRKQQSKKKEHMRHKATKNAWDPRELSRTAPKIVS
ncbi:hypothetical protein Y1Q_0008806 [Alligator mississippiensis]|uniref:Uncharacterized protein n=1 Tax=Alligator mississippiensis TaxID=8496 RepID=A0A151NA25_ALLMI|nr:hypothetical protein Y1Q_0008806 [Alligator mississippiensis]